MTLSLILAALCVASTIFCSDRIGLAAHEGRWLLMTLWVIATSLSTIGFLHFVTGSGI